MLASSVRFLSLAYHLLTGRSSAMRKRSPHHITKRFVDMRRADMLRAQADVIRARNADPATSPEDIPDELLFDRDLPGFGVRIRPSGIVTYVLQFCSAEGRSQRLSLGRHGPVTCEQARLDALRMLGRVAHGENPAADRRIARTAMTVVELGERYFADAEAGRIRGKRGLPKKARTLRTDGYRWQAHVVPLLGKRSVRELARRDIVDFLHRAETQARAAGRTGAGERRLRGLLGAVFNWAVRESILEINPCSGVQTRPDGRRQIALDERQYGSLGHALAVAEQAGEVWQATEALRLIALTGARRGEITGLRWSEVNFEGQALRLAGSKTGASVRPLGRAACALLQRVRGFGGTNTYVFPAVRGEDGPYMGLGRAQGRIIGRAVIAQDGSPLTPHGLRHAFASVAAGELNYSEPTIGALIGHAGTSITSRYIHHLDAVLVAAADAVSGQIAGWLDEGAALAAHEARGAPSSATCVVSDYHPGADAGVVAFVNSDVLTKKFPDAARASLAPSLTQALARHKAGLPQRSRRGAKPQAWGLDRLMGDITQAFADLGPMKARALHTFTTRLLKAAGMKTGRQTLADNEQRARNIARRSLPPTTYKPPCGQQKGSS
jgi:integrase